MASKQASMSSQSPDVSDVVVARAGRYYRFTHLLMGVLLLAAGAWFGYDGWFGWPRENIKRDGIQHKIDDLNTLLIKDHANEDIQKQLAELTVARDKLTKHKGLDIPIQRLLSETLPIAGILMLIWTMYNSRGIYRLEGNTLSVPGHSPIDLSQVMSVDRTKWKKKGLAYVHYQAADGRSGRMRLDDFVYERGPTDEIYGRICRHRGEAEED